MIPGNVQPKYTGKILHFSIQSPDPHLYKHYPNSYVLFLELHIHKHAQRRKSLLNQDLISDKKFAMHIIYICTTKIDT